MLDSGMMSLTMGSNAQKRGLHLVRFDDTTATDTLVYFCPTDYTPPAILAKAQQNELSTHYRAIEAPLCLMTNRSRDELGTLAPLMGSPH
jgi:hypothetical protein